MQLGKTFYTRDGVGTSRYVVNFYNGVKTHKDGSDFYDIEIFNNKRKRDTFIRALKRDGYIERGHRTIDQQREIAAQKAYERYEFNGRLGESDGWKSVTPGNEWTRAVYLDTDIDSEKVTFVVRFVSDDSAEIEEACVSGW